MSETQFPPEPRRRFIGISLKMYFTPSQTSKYISSLIQLLQHLPSHITLFIIPDFLSLTTTSQLLGEHIAPSQTGGPRILLGAQDCFWEDEGPYTGEISAKHLKEIGCGIVELGHAERRKLLGETDECVAKKVRAVLRNGMIPLICIGERNRGTLEDAVREILPQVESVLNVAAEVGNAEIVFAYEPVWAIGASEPASAKYVTEVVDGIRSICWATQGLGRDLSVRVIYGGSAGRGTWNGLGDDVDGLFLGRFAHDVGALKDIINEVATVHPF